VVSYWRDAPVGTAILQSSWSGEQAESLCCSVHAALKRVKEVYVAIGTKSIQKKLSGPFAASPFRVFNQHVFGNASLDNIAPSK
jgi:hypothetical protein